MHRKINKDDYSFAQKICKALKSENFDAITEIHSRFHNRFSGFVRLRISGYISHDHDVDEVMNTFWIELLNGKAICSYQGKNNASLYGFLLKTLNWRVCDWIRQQVKSPPVLPTEVGESRYHNDITGPQRNKTSKETNSLRQSSWETSQPSPHSLLDRLECRKLFSETLLELEQMHPDDACLIHLRLKGMVYKEMAEKTGKKESAVKKQFTRSDTGSLAKFKLLLVKNMDKQRISIKDLIDCIK